MCVCMFLCMIHLCVLCIYNVLVCVCVCVCVCVRVCVMFAIGVFLYACV